MANRKKYVLCQAGDKQTLLPCLQLEHTSTDYALKEFVQNYRHPDLQRECSGVARHAPWTGSASSAGRAQKTCFGGPGRFENVKNILEV